MCVDKVFTADFGVADSFEKNQNRKGETLSDLLGTQQKRTIYIRFITKMCSS